MKLRNKKTGEIGELQITEKHCAVSVGNGTASCGIEIYSSLAELNEDWEDYKEPKEFWFIDDEGYSECEQIEYEDNLEKMKQIGNYFETKEEAEKVVEKLKAWKRLRDKGFRFDGWYVPGYLGDFNITGKGKHLDSEDTQKDLDLLFGGEE